MIDSNVHILPGVDDGAANEEQAIYMLEKAKADGITHWIVTPHFNWESNKYTYDDLRQKYDDWFRTYGETYASGNLLFGMEVYINEFFLENLEKMSRLPTFENSHYMLVEFNLDWTYEQIKDAINKLKSYGVVPIVAHIETYLDLTTDAYKVKLLSEEGALIQLTASSFFIKSQQKFIQEVMMMNSVDLVASNGHDPTIRPPVLSDSYNHVARYYSKAWANRLFNETPMKIFYGEHYFRPLSAVKLRKSYRASMGVSVAFGLTLLAVGLSQFINKPTDLVRESEIVITEEAIPAGFAEVLTYEEIIKIGKEKCSEIYHNYESDLKALHEMIFSKNNITPDFKVRIDQIDTYQSELAALEIKYDSVVLKHLNEMEETLKINGYSTGVIEGLKSEYRLFKEAIKTKYLEMF